jgi:arylsulfatase A-like enzyme
MKRREFLKSAGLAVAGTGLAGCGRTPPPPQAAGRPNILFLFADQLRPDMLGPYGGTNIPTPNLDRLAREGLTFDNALSPTPLCTPYRGMLLTGRYPTHSGLLVNRVDANPRQNPECMAQLFEAAGYDTGFLGKWHLSAGIRRISERLQGDEQAIEAYKRENPHYEFTPPGPDRLGFEHWEAYNYHTDFRDYWFYRDTPEKIRTGKYETAALVDQAIAYMSRRGGDTPPFLLLVAPHPPHPPFAPDYCPPGYLETVTQQLSWRGNVPAQAAGALGLQVRCYLAMIRHLDDCVGRLLQFLDESGLSATTLLVVTSDHGEMHGSHGLTGKCYPHAESVDLPLMMRWPGTIAANVRRPELYTPMDHLPTFCTLAGLPRPRLADGLDLSDLLRGAAAPARDAVLMANYASGYANFRSGGKRPEWRGLRTERHTYARLLDGSRLLFDNDEDPYQLRNLAGEQPALRDELEERMTALLAEAHDEFLPGTDYAGWFEERRLIRTGLGPVG